MIIDYAENIKTYPENILNFKGNFDYVCPYCGAKRSFVRHGTYQRHSISFIEDWPLEERLCVLRLKCTSCKHTHAILPFDIIPFSIYCAMARLNICAKVYLQGIAIQKLCEKCHLSYQVIYGFIKQFKAMLHSLVLFLRQENLWNASRSPSFKETLELILKAPSMVTLFQKYLYHHRRPLFLNRKSSSSYRFSIGYSMVKPHSFCIFP